MISASSTGVVEVHLGQRPGARPDAVGDQLVVDFFTQLGDLRGLPARHERQRLLTAGRNGGGVLLTADPETQLLPGEPGHVRGSEILASGQPSGEVEDRRAHDHGVVDVEECCRGEVPGDHCGCVRLGTDRRPALLGATIGQASGVGKRCLRAGLPGEAGSDLGGCG